MKNWARCSSWTALALVGCSTGMAEPAADDVASAWVVAPTPALDDGAPAKQECRCEKDGETLFQAYYPGETSWEGIGNYFTSAGEGKACEGYGLVTHDEDGCTAYDKKNPYRACTRPELLSGATTVCRDVAAKDPVCSTDEGLVPECRGGVRERIYAQQKEVCVAFSCKGTDTPEVWDKKLAVALECLELRVKVRACYVEACQDTNHANKIGEVTRAIAKCQEWIAGKTNGTATVGAF